MSGESEPRPPLDSHRNTFRWAEIAYVPSVFVVGAGLWLIVAGLMPRGDFAGASASAWSKLTVGVVVTLFAAIRVVRPARTAPLSLVNVLLGAWMVASPFVLGYSAAAGPAWNDVVVGAIVVLLAGVSWLAAGVPSLEE